jgi:CBS domain-containing protein
VVIEGSQVVGIFTERDFSQKVGVERKNPDETLIEEVMTDLRTRRKSPHFSASE